MAEPSNIWGEFVFLAARGHGDGDGAPENYNYNFLVARRTKIILFCGGAAEKYNYKLVVARRKNRNLKRKSEDKEK